MNDVIAALERAADFNATEAVSLRMCVELTDDEDVKTCCEADAAKCTADADTIRALIADLQAGRLVRREDVVAEAADQSCTPLDTPPRDLREFMAAVNRLKPLRLQIGSSAAGAHGGGDE